MKKFLVTVLFLTMAATSLAAEPAEQSKQPSPEEMQQLMEMSLGAMVPMMGMTEAMIDAQLKSAEKPETAAKLAAFKKNLYTALLKQGFSKKEAFQIMLNTSPPAAMPGMK